MRIALFHNLLPGGAKRALYEHARYLKGRGYCLDAFVLSTAAEQYLPLDSLCENVFTYTVPAPRNRFRDLGLRTLHHPLTRRVTGHHLYVVTAEHLNVRQQFDQWRVLHDVYAAVADDINGGRYDLTYVHQCRLTHSPLLLGKLDVPSVYYCQDTLRHMYEWSVGADAEDACQELPRETLFERRMLGRTVLLPRLHYFRHLEHEYVAGTRAATCVLANSAYSREAILRTTGVTPRVCYLGVDSNFYCPDAAAKGEPLVVSVGALMPHKRHEFVIRAVGTIPQARRPRLEITGYEPGVGMTVQGSFERRLLDLSEQQGVRLTIIKDASDEAVRDAYRRASVVAFAPYLEPFGLVALEAMACGTPVVGVSEAGLRETIQDGVTGLLTGRDAREFGAALDRLLMDRDLAAELGANGRDTARQCWTWTRSGDTLVRCFSDVLRASTLEIGETDREHAALEDKPYGT